jgi:hypothetical protein
MLEVKIQATGTVETPEQADERSKLDPIDAYEEAASKAREEANARRISKEAAFDELHPLMVQFKLGSFTTENMKDVGHHYRVLAEIMVLTLRDCPDRDACLRSLLESLDAAISAMKEEP